MRLHAVLTAVAVVVGTARAQLDYSSGNGVTPTFFLSLLDSNCEYDGVSMKVSGDNLVKNGRLCAWVEATKQIYACPANSTVCWNLGETCIDGPVNAGVNQTLCNNVGKFSKTWCCNSVSGGCTERDDRPDNCWSSFSNPYNDTEQVLASASASKAIASAKASMSGSGSGSGSTSTSKPSVLLVSALSSGGWVVASSTQSGPSATATSQSTSSDASLQSRLSTGAIAGITVGIILGSVLITATCMVFCFRHRRRVQTAHGGMYQKSHSSRPSWSSLSSLYPSKHTRSPIRMEVPAGKHSVAAELSAPNRVVELPS